MSAGLRYAHDSRISERLNDVDAQKHISSTSDKLQELKNFVRNFSSIQTTAWESSCSLTAPSNCDVSSIGFDAHPTTKSFDDTMRAATPPQLFNTTGCSEDATSRSLGSDERVCETLDHMKNVLRTNGVDIITEKWGMEGSKSVSLVARTANHFSLWSRRQKCRRPVGRNSTERVHSSCGKQCTRAQFRSKEPREVNSKRMFET